MVHVLANISLRKVARKLQLLWALLCKVTTVDPTRSTGWRDSLLIEKSELIFEL